ncbi:MAG: hypothetical protein ABGW86_04020, partial [Candidatus Poseidoniia archaeon]
KELLESVTIFPMKVIEVDSFFYTSGKETKLLEKGVWKFSYDAIEKSVDTIKTQYNAQAMNLFKGVLTRTNMSEKYNDEVLEFVPSLSLNPKFQEWRKNTLISIENRLNDIREADTFKELKELGPMETCEEQPKEYLLS